MSYSHTRLRRGGPTRQDSDIYDSYLRVVSVPRSLAPAHQVFYLYGDVALDMDFFAKKGMVFCENSSLLGHKSCRRVTRAKSFLHFDIQTEGPRQMNDFQYLIDYMKRTPIVNDPTNPGIASLIKQLQVLQNKIDSQKESSFSSSSSLGFLNTMSSQSSYCPPFDLHQIFEKAEQLLQLKTSTPYVHYRIFRKTPQEMTIIRCGVNTVGLKEVGIDLQHFEQSMLRHDHFPVSRDVRNLELMLRNVYELNAYTKLKSDSAEPLVPLRTKIRYYDIEVEAFERTTLHHLTKGDDGEEYLLIINNFEFIDHAMFLAAKNIIVNRSSSNRQHVNSTGGQEEKRMIKLNEESAYVQVESEYSKSAKEFISNFYETQEPGLKKKQQFDKVLISMLQRKQSQLNIQLL